MVDERERRGREVRRRGAALKGFLLRVASVTFSCQPITREGGRGRRWETLKQRSNRRVQRKMERKGREKDGMGRRA